MFDYDLRCFNDHRLFNNPNSLASMTPDCSTTSRNVKGKWDPFSHHDTWACFTQSLSSQNTSLIVVHFDFTHRTIICLSMNFSFLPLTPTDMYVIKLAHKQLVKRTPVHPRINHCPKLSETQPAWTITFWAGSAKKAELLQGTKWANGPLPPTTMFLFGTFITHRKK